MSDEFVSWKMHPITIEVMSELRSRIEQLKNEMVAIAGSGDSHALAEKAGGVKAYTDVLEIELEESNGN